MPSIHPSRSGSLNQASFPRYNLSMRLLVTMVVALALSASAQSVLQPIPSAEAPALQARLDPKLPPSEATQLHLDTKQLFTLQSATGSLTLVPVTFASPFSTDGATLYSCGLYLLPARGSQRFLSTYNLRVDKPGQCGSLAAIGLENDRTAHPRIILIYNAYVPPRQNWQQPVVLTWDPTIAQYLIGPDMTNLDHDGTARWTVAEVRRYLTHR